MRARSSGSASGWTSSAASSGRAGRKADDSGLRALLDAVGNDLRDLAAACSQLAADTDGVITTAVVTRYYHGRAEATGFSVADRAVEGNLADALEQLRWALATGMSPVLITSALATGLRAGAGRLRGRGLSPAALAADLGMPPWKIDKVRRQLRGWSRTGWPTRTAPLPRPTRRSRARARALVTRWSARLPRSCPAARAGH